MQPRHHFFLNSWRDMRFVSACPECERKPRQRKLPLAIHVEDWGTAVINKTCRYCPNCDLLIAHEDELRELIDRMLGEMQPESIGKPFFVVGTLDRPAWRQGMNDALSQERMLAVLHDFLGYKSYKIVGGWLPAESPPTAVKPK